MPSSRVRPLEDTVPVAAPAGVVYGILADAARWPLLLAPVLHAERMDFDGTQERLRVWDLVDGRVRTTHARRRLRPPARTVRFQEEDIARRGCPVTGTWTVRAAGDERSLLSLRLEGAPAGPGPDALDLGRRLEQVRQAAERWDRLDELLLSFEDEVRLEGPAELVYDFLYRVQDWARLIPHVERADLTEDRPGVQVSRLDSCAQDDGRTVTTRTVRLCFPHAGRIVYKDTATAEPIAAHTGEWSLVPDALGTRIVSTHRVLLREEAVGPVLGEGTSLLEARRYVREYLGRAGRETLELARWHAESAVHRLR
jgi:aromatase